MNLNLEFHETLPKEFHETAERSLRNAINFLDNQPRPKATPPIQNFVPDWGKLKFTIGEIFPSGKYRPSTMEGWVHQIFRTNGDLVLDSEPLTTIMNVDLEIANTCHAVGHLDGVYYSGINTESQLTRQLQYLDSIAANNQSVRSLLDDYEQQQAEQEEVRKEFAYRQQYTEKQYQQTRKYKYDSARRIPRWYLEKYPNAPQCKGEFIVTVGGQPVGTHLDWEQAQLVAPPENEAIKQVQLPQEPRSEPFALPEFEDQVQAFMQMQAAALGQTAAGTCEDGDK